MRRLLAIGWSAWAIIAAVLLITGHSILVELSPFGIPWGNLIAWTGLIAFPAAQILGLYHLRNRREDPRIGIFHIAAWGALVLSIFWGVLSYGLSGNWSFVFSQNATGFIGSPEAAAFFLYISMAAGLLPLVILLLYLIYRAL